MREGGGQVLSGPRFECCCSHEGVHTQSHITPLHGRSPGLSEKYFIHQKKYYIKNICRWIMFTVSQNVPSIRNIFPVYQKYLYVQVHEIRRRCWSPCSEPRRPASYWDRASRWRGETSRWGNKGHVARGTRELGTRAAGTNIADWWHNGAHLLSRITS